MAQLNDKWAASPILRLNLLVDLTAGAAIGANNGELHVILPSGASTNITLPTASAEAQVAVKDMSGDLVTKTITITPAGGALIDGAGGAFNLSSEYETVYLISDGTNWFRI